MDVSPLAIAGLGLLPGFTATVPVAGGTGELVLLLWPVLTRSTLKANALGED